MMSRVFVGFIEGVADIKVLCIAPLREISGKGAKAQKCDLAWLIDNRLFARLQQ